MKFTLLYITGLFLCSSAYASESWVCTYDGGDKSPQIIKFMISNNQITRSDNKDRTYTILQNNESGIVAAGAHDPADVGVFYILLNKKEKQFVYSAYFWGSQDMNPIKGNCVPD